MLLLLFLFVTIATSSSPDVNMTQWMQGVEHLASTISIPSPLKSEFTPEYLAKRTLKASIQNQWAAFRSQVAVAMVNSIDDEVTVCPSLYINDKVIKAMKEELEERGFVVHIISNDDVCYKKSGLLVRIGSKPAIERNEL